MRGGFLLLGLGIITSTISVGQVKKQFSIDNTSNVERVQLNFGVNAGDCYLKASQTPDLIAVYGNKDHDSYSHSFNKEMNEGVCKVNLHLQDDKSAGLGKSISYRMFGDDNARAENLWKVYLAEDKAFDLNLKYGIGTANIDFTNLKLEKVKINTGSADVFIKTDEYNTVAMDTFFLQVDMGSARVQNINKTKAQHVIAEVGFGDLLMDFSDQPMAATHITGSVGAGNLMIILPDTTTPVKVKISDSWLCKVKMLKDFRSIGSNTFVNSAYSEDAANILSFDLDVSMGKIMFKEAGSSSNHY